MKAITTTYHGPTNTRGSRVSASDEDGNRVSLSYESDLNSDQMHDKAAKALCIKMDWTKHDLVRGGTKNGYVYVFDAPWERVTFTEQDHAEAAKNRGKARNAGMKRAEVK